MAEGPLQVVVAGGGVAGLEALLALRDLAGDRVALTLLTPEEEFVYRPMATAEPFSRGHARRHRVDELAERVGARLVRGALTSVDDAGRVAVTATGEPIGYDALLVAVGAQSAAALRAALTWTPETDPELFGGLLRDIDEGYTRRVAFVVPPGNAWPLPAYELALMTAWQAYDMNRSDLEITVYTPEDAPLHIFGAAASAALRADLEEIGIAVQTGSFVADDDGHLVLHPGGGRLDADRVIALPLAAGPALAGLPADRLGFVLADRYGKVPGTDSVWVAGDAMSFPVKQGGLAAQEADVGARAIAARAGADVEVAPFRPVLRGVLLTGRGRHWMRHDIAGGDGEGQTAGHALFWPPTKVAGRYLAPFLFELEEAEDVGQVIEPDGHAVQLDLEREMPAAADALRMASLRDEEDRARFAVRRAAERAEADVREMQREADALGTAERDVRQELRRGGFLPGDRG